MFIANKQLDSSSHVEVNMPHQKGKRVSSPWRPAGRVVRVARPGVLHGEENFRLNVHVDGWWDRPW
jgi:hypothetical protein